MPHRSAKELARQAWKAVSEGDAAALHHLWTEDVVWQAIGNHPWAGRFEGVEEVLEHIAQIGDSVERFDARLDEIFASDTRIVYFYHLTAGRGARVVDVDYIMAALHREGRMSHIWLAALDPELLESLWNPA